MKQYGQSCLVVYLESTYWFKEIRKLYEIFAIYNLLNFYFILVQMNQIFDSDQFTDPYPSVIFENETRFSHNMTQTLYFL